MCKCQAFCETHGRDYVVVWPDGSQYCGECAADIWGSELCTPNPDACDALNPNANEWERQFMCEQHAAEHVKFCEEAIAV